MSAAHVVTVEPDIGFKEQILGLGAHDLTACYQCGTCSVVCPISTAQNPFPRKEMVWVQWGLKDLALSNSSIWACHDCDICTTYCPRDAKPGEVMRALREVSIAEYAVPRFMGRALQDPRFLPLLFALPAVIFLAVLGGLGHLTSLPGGTVVFSKFLPILYIEVIFVAAMAVSLSGAVMGGLRYWRAMCARTGPLAASPVQHLLPTLLTILRHQKFRQCGADLPGAKPSPNEGLQRGHAFAFYGFVGLVITTAAVGVGIYAFGYLTPWPLWHPVKLLGNISGLAVIGSVSTFSWRRIARNRHEGKSTYADWLFLDILLLTTLTGFLAQLLRLTGSAGLAYPTYLVHLMFVFFLLVYIPYSKFSHLIYRTVAMLYEECAYHGLLGHEPPARACGTAEENRTRAKHNHFKTGVHLGSGPRCLGPGRKPARVADALPPGRRARFASLVSHGRARLTSRLSTSRPIAGAAGRLRGSARIERAMPGGSLNTSTGRPNRAPMWCWLGLRTIRAVCSRLPKTGIFQAICGT